MTPVFAYYADLSSRASEPDHKLFEKASARIAEWVQAEIGGDFALAFDGEERLIENHFRVAARRDKIDSSHELVHVLYSHANADRSLLYQLKLDLLRVPQGVQFALLEEAHTMLTGMVPLQVTPYLPGIVRDLAADADLQVHGERVPLAPQRLEEKFIGRFVESQLLSPTRVLPVIAVSPHAETGQPIVAAADLQVATFGLAHVVDLLSKQATFEITNRLGGEWACYNGAVRIYWPGLQPEREDFRRHPIYFPDQYPPGMEAALCGDIFRRLASAALVKFGDPPKRKVYRAAAERKRQEEESRHIVALTAGVEQAKQLQEILERLQRERVDLTNDLELAKMQNAEHAEELAAQREQWAGFERELDETRKEAVRERRIADALRRRFVGKIASVAEAVEYAREDFAGAVEFLPSAFESAKESPYEHPDKIYELFRALANIMSRIQVMGSVGTNLFEEMKKHGYEYKDKLSMTSATKFGRDYTFQYQGKPTLFESHVTRGSGPPRSCISVHWIRDDRRKLFVVGWCGKHLTNTMS